MENAAEWQSAPVSGAAATTTELDLGYTSDTSPKHFVEANGSYLVTIGTREVGEELFILSPTIASIPGVVEFQQSIQENRIESVTIAFDADVSDSLIQV